MQKVAIFLGGSKIEREATAEYIRNELFHNGWAVYVFGFSDPLKHLTDVVTDKLDSISSTLPKETRTHERLVAYLEGYGKDVYSSDIWIGDMKKRIASVTGDDRAEKVCVIIDDVEMDEQLTLADSLIDFTTTSIMLTSSTNVDAGTAFQWTIVTEGDFQFIIRDILRGLDMIQTPKETLQDLLNYFNAGLQAWSSDTGLGANFDWKYDSDGIKRLHIRDVAMIDKLPEDKAAIKVKEVAEVFDGLESRQD